MNDDKQADEVRQRMAQLRSALAGDVNEMSESARAMADWRYYVRRFPLATTAAMAAVGFFLVPRKGGQENGQLPPDLAELIKQNKIPLEQSAMGAKAGGILSSVVSVVGAAALRMATAYVTERVQAALRPDQTEDEEEDAHSASPPR